MEDLIKEVLEKLNTVIEQQEEIIEGQAQLRESIANMSLPGRDYDIEEYE